MLGSKPTVIVCRSLFCAVFALVLVACSNASTGVFGGGKPDAFAVYSPPPLSIPPNFDLRPPPTDAPLNLTGTAEDVYKQSAKQALTGQSLPKTDTRRDTTANYSDGMQELLQASGALDVPPGLRESIEQEAVSLNKKQSKQDSGTTFPQP